MDNNFKELKQKPIVTCQCCKTEYHDLKGLKLHTKEGHNLGLDWYDCPCGSTITVEKQQPQNGISELEANILSNIGRQKRLKEERNKHNRKTLKSYRLKN